jgi:hypothetical protein
MGEGADMLTEYMERGQSWVYDKIEKKKFVVENVYLMYTKVYDQDRYVVLGDYDEP